MALGLWKLYKRNTLKMPLWEKAQIVLGLSIPFFLLPHLIYSYGTSLIWGQESTYIDNLMATYPHFSWQYTAMTLAIWIHAQIGFHVVMRMRHWYPKVRPLIIFFFITMPLIGIGGYFKGALEAADDIKEKKETVKYPEKYQVDYMSKLSYSMYIIFPLIYAGVLSGRVVRIRKNNKRKNIEVRYSTGRSVPVFPETTILEASRIGEIPHASICGGRGRCTTCRVKVESGMENLSPVGDRERSALDRIKAEKDVRLACQSECLKDRVSVTLLLPADIKPKKARKETSLSVGSEMELAVMFVDIRGFTRMSEEKFPYDVVFLLNHYFNYVGEIIEKNGGTIDKFMGDGILAFFGFKTDPVRACRSALASSKQIAEKLIEINSQLKNDLKEPLEIGIGLHFGEVILGELGYRDKSSLTIIGDTVNTASRLESLNKKTESQLIFSASIAEKSGLDFSHIKKRSAIVRGKKDPIDFYVVKNIQEEI